MLSNETKTIVKSTAPVLAQHGLAITEHFYRRMFNEHPDLKGTFNQAHQAVGDQPRALANAVYAYAENIEQPEVLADAIKRIAHKHASLNIRPQQYDIVGHHLLASIKEVLGDAATDEIIAAWASAYKQLADILIGTEQTLYREAAAAPGGWEGWRPFVIRRRVEESTEIASFYLAPVDGGGVPEFHPGQYVSVKVFVPALGLEQPRQYSLSRAPGGDELRISVKREESRGESDPGGLVSNILHERFREGDELEVSPPFGEFVLQEQTGPVVLISGGVGITPLMSMLESLAGSDRQVVFIHGARNSTVRALKNQVDQITAASNNVRVINFLEEVSADEQPGRDYNHTGRVDLNAIREQILPPQAAYYLCGPLPFIRVQRDALLELGVPAERIHYEVFGSNVLDG